jgi:hypothetical protein
VQTGLPARAGAVAGTSRMLVGTLAVRHYGAWTQLMEDKVAFVRAPPTHMHTHTW